LDHALQDALLACAPDNAEFSVAVGPLDAGWVTAAAFFADSEAIDAFLDHEGSHNPGADPKTRAALLILDYCYVFMLASVPLLVGAGIVPDLSPSNMALQFFDGRHEHGGRSHANRRAHVRYLSPRFFDDRAALCGQFRAGVEAHFAPLVDVLFRKTGLSRNALWRLVADAVAGRCLEVGRQRGCIDEAKAIGMQVVKQPGSPLHNRQLRYFDLTLYDDTQKIPLGSWTFRARGGCCRFYTVLNGTLCSICVLKDPEERDAELLEAMRAHVHRLAHNET
jgi:hypothetical protein